MPLMSTEARRNRARGPAEVLWLRACSRRYVISRPSGVSSTATSDCRSRRSDCENMGAFGRRQRSDRLRLRRRGWRFGDVEGNLNCGSSSARPDSERGPGGISRFCDQPSPCSWLPAIAITGDISCGYVWVWQDDGDVGQRVSKLELQSGKGRGLESSYQHPSGLGSKTGAYAESFKGRKKNFLL